MIVIIDYDAGNMKSVQKAFEYLGEEVVFTRDRQTILDAPKLVLPGVGAFGDAMGKLRQYDLEESVRTYIKSGKPFMGICLGLQLLFESSEETPGIEGLGILKGRILRFPDDMGLKIPHMGWNSLDFPKKGRLFENISPNPYVYFVHSYYLQAADLSDVAATSAYGLTFHAAVEHENVFACQFHPEKSSGTGLQILQNFAEMKL